MINASMIIPSLPPFLMLIFSYSVCGEPGVTHNSPIPIPAGAPSEVENQGEKYHSFSEASSIP
jgi:hypothetical protein